MNVALPTLGHDLGAGLLLNFTFYGEVFVLSLFFQEIQGQSALQTGLSFLPMTALIAVSNLIAPRLAARMGSLAVIVLGALLLAAGLAAVFAVVGQHHAGWQIASALVPIGIGVGISIPPLTSQALEAVEGTLAGVASGAYNASRQIGGAVGVALFGALLGGTQISGFMYGMRISLLVSVAAAIACVILSFAMLRPGRRLAGGGESRGQVHEVNLSRS